MAYEYEVTAIGPGAPLQSPPDLIEGLNGRLRGQAAARVE
jgi:hypothetical protein